MNLCIGVIYKTGNQFQTVLDPDANNGVIVRNNLSTKEMHKLYGTIYDGLYFPIKIRNT